LHQKKQWELRVIEEEIMKVLFDLHTSKINGQRTRMGEILDCMENQLTKTQLTNIVRRKLEPLEYVDYLPYEGVRLTEEGYQVAQKVARNHRLSEAMLYQIFDMPFSELHEQALHLEHGISDEFAEHIYRKLKVKMTPFGMPIPMNEKDKDLGCEEKCLREIPAGTTVTLTRIQNHSTETAKELEIRDINAIGVKMYVKSIDNEGVVIELNEKSHKIPLQLSRHLCVKSEE
jgi:DtxR family Mn-dependent transcriptional regulator